MHYVGIDLHKVHSQICIQDERGNVLQELRVKTTAEALSRALASPPAKVLLESSGSSEWAASLLERLGHEVIVGDPGYVVMYGTVSRRVKTDRRDARALADACRLGAYRRAHRTSTEQRRVRQRLVARDTLVKARTRLITTCQGLLRQFGIYAPTGSAERFVARILETEIPEELKEDLVPVFAALAALNEAIARSEKTIEELAEKSEVARRLQTLPGVGPITALGFVSRVDDPTRFSDSGKVSAYFGLVPSEYSSGEKKVRGRITKTGDKYIRTLMLQLSLRILRLRSPATAPLWLWAERIATRRGKNIARVALARRLTKILFSMMRHGTAYTPEKLTRPAIAA